MAYAVWSLMNTESTGFVKTLSGSNRRHWGLTDSNIKSINNLNCSQDAQPDQPFLEWKCFPFIL